MHREPTSRVLGTGPDGFPIAEIELAAIVHGEAWIGTFALPHVFARLRRIPPKAYLLKLVDEYLPYAHSKRFLRYVPHGEPRMERPERGACADQFRELLALWEPPVLTPELRDAARALFIADGLELSELGWQAFEVEQDPTPVEAALPWPEGAWNEETFLEEKRRMGEIER